MEKLFITDYVTIIDKIEHIDPLKYGKTRNCVDGDVTCLSPCISRGVVSKQQILEKLLAKGYKISEIASFVKELCWRDYFQRVGQVKNLNQEIKQPQHIVLNSEIPKAIVNALTGIAGIDNAINQLYNNGGSNYLIKMSDYKKGVWQQIWDGLFWRFMDTHRDFFLQNPRLGMLVRTFDKMPETKQQNHLKHANQFLDSL